jgi:hypothetical protein
VVNVMEMRQAMFKVEKDYKIILEFDTCYWFIDKIGIQIENTRSKQRNKNAEWFRKIIYSVMNELNITGQTKKAYMSVAGRYFGKRGGRKAASNREKKKEIQRNRNTEHLQTTFSLEKKVFTQAEISS